MTRSLFLFIPLFLIACSKAPDIPSLPNNTPDASAILLHGVLHAKDIRTLFRQVNKNGRLNALKPFLEDPSDAELEIFAGLVSRQVYQEMDSPNGLVAAVQKTIDSRSFSEWRDYLADTPSDPSYRDRAELLLSVAQDPKLVPLVKRDKQWLQPDWLKHVHEAWSKAQQEYKETQDHPPVPEVTAEQLTADLQKLVLPADARKNLLAKVAPLVDSHAFFPLARLSRELRGESGVKAFEGLGYGFAQLLAQPASASGSQATGSALSNRLDQTFFFLHQIDRPTDGLFSALATSLRSENTALGQAAAALRPLYARAVNDSLRKTLAAKPKSFWLALPRQTEGGPPSAAFVDFFRAARLALSELIGKVRDKNAVDEFSFNLTLDFDAYAMARWAEAVVLSNRADFEKLPEAEFAAKIWTQKTKDDAPPLDCTENNQKLAADVAADFKALGEERIAEEASNAIAKGGYGDFVYPFTGGDFATFAQASEAALAVINIARPYADPEPTVKLFAHEFLTPDSSGKSLVEHLDSANLLISLQNLIGGLGPESWQTVKYWLFDKLALDHLSADTRKLLLGLYSKQPALGARFGEILDGLPLLGALDLGVNGLPSPFSVYHRFLSESDLAQRTAAGRALAFAGEAHWASPAYPALQASLADGSNVARTLHSFGYLSAEDADTFTRTLSEMFSGDGLASHLDVLAAQLKERPQAVAAWLRALPGLGDAPSVPTPLQAWLVRFVESPDFPILVDFVRAHATRASSLQLAHELNKLSRSGELREACALLTYLRSDRLRDLGAIFKAWTDSKELEALFATLDSLLTPLVDAPAS